MPSEPDRIFLILDDPAGGIDYKDDRQFLDRMRNLTGQVDVIGQIGRGVGEGIHEVHPPKGEAREEGNGVLENGC